MKSIDSSSNDVLLKEYLKNVLILDDTHIFINSWNILENIKLLKLIIRNFTHLYKFSDVNGIVILADSGIPLGVFLALSAKKDFFLFKRSGFFIEYNGKDFVKFLFPLPKTNSKIILADSHIISGYTVNICMSYLKSLRINCNAIIAPIFFNNIFPNRVFLSIPKINVIQLIDDKQKITRILRKYNKYINQIYRQDIGNIFNKRDFESFITSSKNKNVFQIIKSWKNIFQTNIDNQFNVIDNKTRIYLQGKYKKNESEIWNLLSNYSEMELVCKKINKKINLTEYDCLYGTNLLGLIFSLIIAWHCGFNGKIYTDYENKKILSNGNKNINKVLICTGRIRTGLYLKNIVDKLKQNNIQFDIVVLHYSPAEMKFPRKNLLNENLYKIEKQIYIVY